MPPKNDKTNSDRIMRIYELCKMHFGEVRFVGIKYHHKIGWIAKVQFNGEYENLTADGDTSTDALRQLKNRVKKIIKRYETV